MRVKAEDIFDKPLTKRQRQDLADLKTRPERKIDYSDIPPLSGKQLASAFRPIDKHFLLVRLDRDVMQWLNKSGESYSAHINRTLRSEMRAGVSTESRRG